MSAEARKNCRTQGKYGDKNVEDRKSRKSLEKTLKESPTEKESQEKKFLKRKSDGTKEDTSFSSENKESQIEYQDNSEYSFSKLEERKKPIQIKKPGKYVLSNTKNGESSVLYEPDFYTDDEACDLFDILNQTTNWLEKNIVIHGVEYPQPRLVTWYGPLPYSYSGTTLEPAEMPDCVLAIKRRVEDYLKGKNIDVELNSVLLNLYRNNKDSVSWHSDDEFTMGVCPTIASISLGETRKFEMRPKPNRYCEDENEKIEDEYFVHLKNGSLIVMDGCMQEDWQHRVPKEYHDRRPRINLTFRTVYKFENGSPYSYSRVNNYKPVEREIPKNPSKIKIELDEENFPPLSFVSGNVNTKTAQKPCVKAESSQIGMNRNKISEKELEINYPNYETPSKINERINNSEEQWTIETPPSNKTTSIETLSSNTTLIINDKINASEEECVEIPVCSKNLFKANDAVSKSQGEFASKSVSSHETCHRRDDVHEYVGNYVYITPPYEKPITKTNGTANESEENLTIKSLSHNSAYPEADENKCVKYTFSNRAPPDMNISNTSEEEWTLDSPVKNNSLSQFQEISKSHYNYSEKAAYSSQLTSLEPDNKLHKDWYDESCNSQILLESGEINELHEVKHEKTLDYHQQTSPESDKIYGSYDDSFEKTLDRQLPLENKINKFHENRNLRSYTRPNRFQSDRSYRYHDERDAKSFRKRNDHFETNRYHRHNERRATEPFHYKNISRQEKNFKSDDAKSFECIEKKCVKTETLNKNTDDYEQRSGKYQNFNSKDRRNESSNFAIHSMRKHFTDIRNEPVSSRNNGWKPNVKAEEFIPGKLKELPSKMDTFSSSVDSSTFGHLDLKDLMKYDMDCMPSDELKDYANVLKLRVLNKISEFEPSDNEELKVLCDITDGNQTDRNQKIICSRIYVLVNRNILHKKRNRKINPTMPKYPQQANYRNENHHSDRRYQDSGLES